MIFTDEEGFVYCNWVVAEVINLLGVVLWVIGKLRPVCFDGYQ
jgi:hypothetical protein